MSLINIDRLRQYADLGLNVLLEGHGGVGKSSAILESFGNLKHKYFSAPTLDPWVDLIGAPKVVPSDKHRTEVLKLIPPEWVLDDDVEIIFFDELNRAADKVLDAVMELIQFKSINGRKFTKLRAVWAAINPADDTGDYHVEELDRALRDRFHVQIQVPYAVDEEWFNAAHPENGPVFCEWWASLRPDVKAVVSPRRLDYVATAFENGLPLSDFLPSKAPITELRAKLRMKPFASQLDAIKNDAEAAKFLKDINNATQLSKLVQLKDKQATAFFRMYRHFLPEEIAAVTAAKAKIVENGEPMITTLEGLLAHLKGLKAKNGSPAIYQAINNADFALYFKNGGSLQQAMKSIVRTKPTGYDTLIANYLEIFVKGTRATLQEACFKAGERSNFMNMFMALVSADESNVAFSKEARKKMSNHMYLHDVVGAKWA